MNKPHRGTRFFFRRCAQASTSLIPSKNAAKRSSAFLMNCGMLMGHKLPSELSVCLTVDRGLGCLAASPHNFPLRGKLRSMKMLTRPPTLASQASEDTVAARIFNVLRQAIQGPLLWEWIWIVFRGPLRMRAHGNHSFSFKTSEHSHRAHFLGGEMRGSSKDNPNPCILKVGAET